MVNNILTDTGTKFSMQTCGTGNRSLYEIIPEGKENTKKRIKFYITPATKKTLEKYAKRCDCSMMFICRMAWMCGHETFLQNDTQSIRINPEALEQVNTKKAVPIYIDVSSELKRELQKDADILKISLSQYLRLLLTLYLKNLKVRE